MNESFETTRYALDDDELDGLLSGQIDPDVSGMDSNPVASFFAEVRTRSFADTPTPDTRLSEVFAAAPSAPSPQRTASRSVSPRSVSPRSVSPRSVSPPLVTGATPALITPERGDGGEPTVLNLARSTGPVDRPAPTRVRKNPGFIPAPDGIYRTSPVDGLLDLLRPTPTKLLVGASVLLVLFISAQILWFGGDSGEELQEIAGVETSAAAGAGSEATGPAPTTAVPLVESTVSTETTPSTETPATPPPTPAPAPTAPTTAPVSPQIGPTSPTVETTPTTAPTVPTSTPSVTESTPAPTDTTVIVDSTLPPTQPVTPSTGTVPPTEPTQPVTTIPTATITPGIVSVVPANIPAGVYRATVVSPAGCTVQVVNGDGNQSNYQAAAGTDIVFQLFAGSRVLTAAGCPTVFQVS